MLTAARPPRADTATERQATEGRRAALLLKLGDPSPTLSHRLAQRFLAGNLRGVSFGVIADFDLQQAFSSKAPSPNRIYSEPNVRMYGATASMRDVSRSFRLIIRQSCLFHMRLG